MEIDRSIWTFLAVSFTAVSISIWVYTKISTWGATQTPKRILTPAEEEFRKNFQSIPCKISPQDAYKFYDLTIEEDPELTAYAITAWEMDTPEAIEKRGNPHLIGALLGRYSAGSVSAADNDYMIIAWMMTKNPKYIDILRASTNDSRIHPMVRGSAKWALGSLASQYSHFPSPPA